MKDAKTSSFKYFYTTKSEKQKCDWLKMIKPPFGNKPNNIVVYNSENGVCYEALIDINIGEELLALFDDERSKPSGIRFFISLNLLLSVD